MKSSARRKERSELTQEAFDSLLEWLDSDRVRSGEKYEKIRLRLIKIFACRGCSIPEELADRTIDRVARKVGEVAQGYEGDPAFYFYGVAHRIYLEYLKTKPPVLPPYQPGYQDESDLRLDCLDRCLERLPSRSRSLIVAYYGVDPRNKDESRSELARQLRIGSNALWIRAHRIRENLRRCMNECLGRARIK
jgi:DNA-directed RNA polymerase specialized sigma24 family protein